MTQTLGDKIESKHREIRSLRRDLAGINPKLSYCKVIQERIMHLERELDALEALRQTTYAT